MPDKNSKSYIESKNISISKQLQQYIDTIQFFDDNFDDYIYIFDLTNGRIFLTDKIREKFPIPPADEDGNDFNDWNNIVYSKDKNLMNHYIELLIKGEVDSFDINYRIIDRAGNKVWVRVKGTLREKKDTQSFIIVGRIIEIDSVGIIDNLTGLFCRETFIESIKQNFKIYDGYLMILGIDNLQNINITHGRKFGDTVLKKVAEILDTHTKYPIELYRLDGDCFAVNFIQQKQEDVETFYYSVKKALKNVCTVSAGIINYKHNENIDSGTVYLYAETALNKAKKDGKNRMFFFSEDNYQKNLQQIELFVEMKECIQNNCNGFYLEYQPQVNCQDFSVCGVEALVRYESPSKGRISPIEFIPLLEQTGLICNVGEWVLKTALFQCKQWRKHIPNINVSVNISYVQLQQDGFTDIVLDSLKEIQLPGNALTLEITESMPLQNYCYFNKIFYVWKQNGIKISIDDFGTGYSSLSYLKNIEINELKIDRCFVNHIQYNTYNFRLLKNIIELAHSTNIEVCCEGVETFEELVTLQELHSDIFQGYFFAKPYSVSAFEDTYINTDSKAYRDRQERESKIYELRSNESKELLEELRNDEIGNIIESMDEMVYVSDPETYELYYLNAAGRRITGVYDYKGCKCYKVLQGKNKPCDFCTNAKLCTENFLIWEIKNTFLERHFIMKDKLIPWKGKMARVEIAFDITEKEILSQSIQKRLNFEKVIGDVCKILFNNDNTVNSIYNVLKIIGEFFEGDRVYILKYDTTGNLLNLNGEWCAKGKDSIKNFLPISTKQIHNEKSKQRIVSPIIHNNKIIGFLCVDNPQYIEDGDNIVATIANFIGYTIINAENQDKLHTPLASQN